VARAGEWAAAALGAGEVSQAIAGPAVARGGIGALAAVLAGISAGGAVATAAVAGSAPWLAGWLAAREEVERVATAGMADAGFDP
jgi:hypothetical protein